MRQSDHVRMYPDLIYMRHLPKSPTQHVSLCVLLSNSFGINPAAMFMARLARRLLSFVSCGRRQQARADDDNGFIIVGNPEPTPQPPQHVIAPTIVIQPVITPAATPAETLGMIIPVDLKMILPVDFK